MLFAAPSADAGTRAKWTKVQVRAGDDATRVSKTLKKMLKRATRKAKWGRGKKLELSARVAKLSWEKREDAGRRMAGTMLGHPNPLCTWPQNLPLDARGRGADTL